MNKKSELKYRVPVVCQNGHESYWDYQTKGLDVKTLKSASVNNPDCECPKYNLGQGWGRDYSRPIELL